jgi:uroporphyrinogen-III decarboxylase
MDMTGTAWPEARSDPEKMAALALAGCEIPDLQNRILYNKHILSHSTQKNGLSRGKK